MSTKYPWALGTKLISDDEIDRCLEKGWTQTEVNAWIWNAEWCKPEAIEKSYRALSASSGWVKLFNKAEGE